MATNNSRSLTAELRTGAADGSVKSLAPDRGGDVETNDLFDREMALRFGRGAYDDITFPTQPYPRGDAHIG